jgi:SPP1 family predicted phage head-tail adaptor
MSKWKPRGQMRRLITIQSVSVVPTEDGATANEGGSNTATVTQTWASIEPLSGREAWMAKAQQDTSTHRIRMPYQPGITPKMQAVYQGRVFKFTSVNNIDELNKEIEIMATEVVEP